MTLRVYHVRFLRGLLFNREGEGNKFLQNIGRLSAVSYEILLQMWWRCDALKLRQN
jgi:hypothetical protein